jgi:secretion/DNA translocation related TadE-like protein
VSCVSCTSCTSGTGTTPSAHTAGRVRTRDRGAGTILGLAILGAFLTLTLMLVPVWALLAAKQKLAGAADAAALAAADARLGVVGDYPCPLAATVAHGATLTACAIDGLVVTVAVWGQVGGIKVTAVATAGPSPAAKD